ncbi:PAS domain S-box protein [Roseomonas gilardii]|uniref:histidine kinase n=1 Tax=Roseomonas gilardii TaxID=257708 RepID=A0ABU3MAL3_9PROT|nr:PAS domain S-box protein [Roseomonas gilardii]MDT8329546.1 PAS domain S-box protein [Roseomonas gilardii]
MALSSSDRIRPSRRPTTQPCQTGSSSEGCGPSGHSHPSPEESAPALWLAAEAAGESAFRRIADCTPSMIWLSDQHGNCVFANRHHERTLGYPASELQGQGWRRLVHPDDLGTYEAVIIRALSLREPFQIVVRMQAKGGRMYWMRVDAAPRLSAEGEFLGFVGIDTDMTASHQAEEALERLVRQRTSDLSEANRRLQEQIEERDRLEASLRQMQRAEALGQLTAGVSHDFNNLLTVILGNLRLLQRQPALPGLSPALLARRLEAVRLAAERGALLTSQLLAFSRRQRLDPRPLDMNALIQDMVGLLGTTVGGSIRLDTSLDASPGREAWLAMADPTQIELAVVNLVLNARDAMQGSGTIRIATGNVTLGLPGHPEEPPAGEYVAITVRDTGTGMTPEVRARAFEPFFTTKDVGQGSGLGLSQVLGFVQQSGGGLRVETAPGQGTAIHLYLPRAQARPAAPAFAPAEGQEKDDRTILLVDDEEPVREITALTLRDLGYDVVEAHDGLAALHLLDGDTRFDLLLLDFAMPGMNGVEVAQAARSRRPQLPIMFLTGYAEAPAMAGENKDRILQKPFRTEELARRLTAVLTPACGAMAAGASH